MTQFQDGADRAGRRASIEAALANYPHLPPEQLSDVLQWFRSEASSLDVGLIASNPAIEQPYRAFRADHVDRMTWRDGVRAIVFTLVVIAILIGIVWRGI